MIWMIIFRNEKLIICFSTNEPSMKLEMVYQHITKQLSLANGVNNLIKVSNFGLSQISLSASCDKILTSSSEK